MLTVCSGSLLYCYLAGGETSELEETGTRSEVEPLEDIDDIGLVTGS